MASVNGVRSTFLRKSEPDPIFLNPDYFIGGEARLDRDRAIAAIEEKIARPLGLSVTDAAAGIISVVNSHMVRILRVVSVARGLDPRDFSLVAFGGAGPMHAADLAAELQIPRVIVPEAPGLFSALGLLWADLRADFVATARRNVDAANAPSLQEQLDRLDAEASAWLEREAVARARRRRTSGRCISRSWGKRCVARSMSAICCSQATASVVPL